jgi:hypothetical protein
MSMVAALNEEPMDSSEQLPDVDIRPGTPVADVFLRKGIGKFRAACAWMSAVHYGSNSRADDPMILFEDGRGTCATKHGPIVVLGRELGLDIHKCHGFYRLTDDIITGVAAVLRPHGLAFVPSMHCFIEYGTRHFDLTQGNRTGKNRDLDTFDLVVYVDPEASRADQQRYYAQAFAYYASREPRLAELGMTAVRELVIECHALASCPCNAQAVPTPVTISR